jgi:RNA polymerase sigma-70 factor (ECF subfamily)
MDIRALILWAFAAAPAPEAAGGSDPASGAATAARPPAAPAAASPGPSGDDAALVERLRRGDEAAFASLVDRFHASLVRIALLHVRTRDVAEEVAQEAWLAVVRGVEKFEERCSLKTWLFRILTNIARTRGAREARQVPFSSLGGAASERGDADEGPLVDPDRFRPTGERWANHWKVGREPQRWDDRPEGRLLAAETRAVVAAAIERLPAQQREVITLRDVECCSAEEVCRALGISEANQRVLLHRARSKVRAVIERHLGGERDT